MPRLGFGWMAGHPLVQTANAARPQIGKNQHPDRRVYPKHMNIQVLALGLKAIRQKRALPSASWPMIWA
jgi:hypothetical protein